MGRRIKSRVRRARTSAGRNVATGSPQTQRPAEAGLAPSHRSDWGDAEIMRHRAGRDKSVRELDRSAAIRCAARPGSPLDPSLVLRSSSAAILIDPSFEPLA